jgi:hypothetical protein
VKSRTRAGGTAPRAALALVLLLLACTAAQAQQKVPAPSRTPAPYTDDEFPKWARDLRRAEIIFVGSIPFTMFFTFEGYDTYRYVANGLDPLYAPWPFRPGSTQLYSDQEKIGLVATSLSLSLLVATADWIIGRIHERSARR